MIQYSPLYHQFTCGVIPVGGRTVIMRRQPEAKIGSIHIPDEYQGLHQEDWEAEVVANAETGGWRNGVVHTAKEEEHGHLMDRPPESLTPKERKDMAIWRIPPYFVEKPVVPPGTRILCCWLAGQAFLSVNGIDYYLTDGEHAYKTVVHPQPN